MSVDSFHSCYELPTGSTPRLEADNATMLPAQTQTRPTTSTSKHASSQHTSTSNHTASPDKRSSTASLLHSEIIYETTTPKPPAPSESFYRHRLALSQSKNLKNPPSKPLFDFSGLEHPSDTSYASRYLAGIVPYPSLPTVGSVVPSSTSFVDLLNLSFGDASFSFSRSNSFPSSGSGSLALGGSFVEDAILVQSRR